MLSMKEKITSSSTLTKGGKKLRYEEYEEYEVRHEEFDEEESEDIRPEWSEEYLNSLGMSMSDFV